ncbi:MAG: tRNA (guanosine(37)-N1)-methyltransferase TrmD [Candidatus Paceibacterota bacterium]|jgi:tRNA (guanine37-N1)-methyltransferase
MRFHIITIFPNIYDSYMNESIIGRAIKDKKISLNFYNPRDFIKGSKSNYKPVDGKPYGGGAGMVLQAEPILKAFSNIEKKTKSKKKKVVIFSAKGKPFNQKIAYDWAKKYQEIVFITGRYEGIDERVRIALKAEEISIGPYVLTDGDVAAMVVSSAVVRLLPGVIRLESLKEESHWNLLLKKEKQGELGESGLEYPHYTRPEILKYKGKNYKVPKVLLSGNHKKIEEWRKNS